MRSRSRLLPLIGACAAGASALAYAAFRKELQTARARVQSGRQFVESPHGPIEFAEAGQGPPLLVIHGAGGGHDQGIDIARAFLGDGHRIIAPSRFGYLGTPLPADASPEAQADAHLRVLDALQVDRVPVIGVSAGAPSAMQLCLRHPERCSALVLIVPMAWAPQRETAHVRIPPLFVPLLNTLMSSDFLFWTATRVAPILLVRTILGVPWQVYRDAPIDAQRRVDEMLKLFLPVSRRIAGLWNESEVASKLTRYALEEMQVPTLIMSAADDLYGTYEGALYTAEKSRDGKFVGFATGGHLLLGHEAEVKSEITAFLGRTAMRTAVAA